MVERVLYTDLNPTQFRLRLAQAPIAYLPLGTLEWHGEHLPLGSDGLQSQGFFVELAGEVGGIVLPMLFLGPDGVREINGCPLYGMDFLGHPKDHPRQLDGSAYWVSEALFGQMLEAILQQLARARFRIVVAHGHGPSTSFFLRHRETWQARFGLELFTCWRTDESDGLGIQTDHAGANETSLMMALYPDLVHMELLPSDVAEWPVAVGGKDPRVHTSAAHGRAAIDLQKTRMIALLREALARVCGRTT